MRFPARGGASVVGVSILNQLVQPEGVAPARLPVWTFSVNSDRIGIDTVQIEGPHNAAGPGDTPSRRLIFSCSPARAEAEEPCAKTILAALARRAYRRPLADADVEKLLRFYRAGRAQGTFEAGIQSALERILVDPEFLFRIERDPAAVKPGERVSAQRSRAGLAACRSSSGAAFRTTSCSTWRARGKLKRSGGAASSRCGGCSPTRRSSALVSNFAASGCSCAICRRVTPDVNAFPEFDDNLREAFQRETELFSRASCARIAACRAADGELHVRQRAAGPALRHSERLRQPLPAGDVAATTRAAACSVRAAF